ncbi:MAG: T9SS type A sorting domain-containing protein [Lentimicrobiaceae bacterium]|nr:T9SS type A sorting domain-containing protein [Lentimicrobiaceae bacterium]
MKRVLFLLSIFLFTNNLSFAQNRVVARGAALGELYLSAPWYGIHDSWGPPYYDTLRTAIYRLTENGKKLTIQYAANYFANPEYEMQPSSILADATHGVLYNRRTYSKNNYTHTQLCVSFDYGKNWVFREENIGSKYYFPANVEGILYRGGYGEWLSKSTDYGATFLNVSGAGYMEFSEFGWEEKEAFGLSGRGFYHTFDCFQSYINLTINEEYVFGQISGVFPDVYRGGKAGEVYVSSLFPDPNYYVTYKVSFSADTGHTFRHVFVSESYANGSAPTPLFMSDREPGVFYIIRGYEVEDTNPWGWHMKICVEYYRDYGETLVDIYCHDITKDYEYEEVICDNTTHLDAHVINQSSIQLQWSCSADNQLIRGHHVYRNNMRITNALLTDTLYLDENLPVGNYEYYVIAYYTNGCSDTSNYVEETIGVGIKEVRELEEVSLFPNPTTGIVEIAGQARNDVRNIEIFDVYGCMVETRHALSLRNGNTITVDISHFPTGAYFVRIATEQGVVVRKVVKI